MIILFMCFRIRMRGGGNIIISVREEMIIEINVSALPVRQSYLFFLCLGTLFRYCGNRRSRQVEMQVF